MNGCKILGIQHTTMALQSATEVEVYHGQVIDEVLFQGHLAVNHIHYFPSLERMIE